MIANHIRVWFRYTPIADLFSRVLIQNQLMERSYALA
jgi:hypothetical protein